MAIIGHLEKVCGSDLMEGDNGVMKERDTIGLRSLGNKQKRIDSSF